MLIGLRIYYVGKECSLTVGDGLDVNASPGRTRVVSVRLVHVPRAEKRAANPIS